MNCEIVILIVPMQFSEKHTITKEQIIKETSFSFVFVNIRPFLPYHLLISPKRICKSLVDLSPEETTDLFFTVQKCMRGLSFYASDFTINIQDGKAAGQTVPHVHVHLIPRLIGDLKVNNNIYKEGAFESNIDDEGKIRENRTISEMKIESDFLRSKFEEFF